MGILLLLFSLSLSYSSVADDTALILSCETRDRVVHLIRLTDGETIATYESESLCRESKDAANGGVVCVYFTPDMPVGPGGWNETGWRPMNYQTKIGLGRRPLTTREECLAATQAASGGVVCTNTGVGAKAAHIETNMWCGASSQLKYCLMASARARNFTVCSFPSDGTGAEAGWVRTQISTTCDYQSAQMTLDACSASIP